MSRTLDAHRGHRGRAGRATGRRALRSGSHPDQRVLRAGRVPRANPDPRHGRVRSDAPFVTLPSTRPAVSFSRSSSPARRRSWPKSDDQSMQFGYEVFARRIAQRIFPESRRPRRSASCEGAHARGRFLGDALSGRACGSDLGIYHTLCTRLEVVDGICTGKIIEPPCYGPGKLTAASALGEEVGFSSTTPSSTPTATRTCRCSGSGSSAYAQSRRAIDPLRPSHGLAHDPLGVEETARIRRSAAYLSCLRVPVHGG